MDLEFEGQSSAVRKVRSGVPLLVVLQDSLVAQCLPHESYGGVVDVAIERIDWTDCQPA